MSGDFRLKTDDRPLMDVRCFKRGGRARRIYEDDAAENRGELQQVPKFSCLAPIKHGEMRDPALHSIDVNSILDRYSPALSAERSTKRSSLCDYEETEQCSSRLHHQADKTVPQSRNDSLANAQEDYSASSSAGFISTVSEEYTKGFIVWSNPIYYSEACDVTSGTTESSSQMQTVGFSAGRGGTNSQEQDRSSENRDLDRLIFTPMLSAALKSGSSSVSMPSASGVAGSSPPLLSERSLEEDDTHLNGESSVGSTASVDEITCPNLWQDLSTKRSFFDFGKVVRKITDSSTLKNINSVSHKKIRQHGIPAAVRCGIENIHEEVACLSLSDGMELHREITAMTEEEATIRAELEIEIEKALEREIKRKILLLKRRLAELHALQSYRYSRFEKTENKFEKDGTVEEDLLPKSSSELHDTSTEIKGNLPNSLDIAPDIHDQCSTIQAEKISTQISELSFASGKLSPSPGKNSVHFNYSCSPLTYWRKDPILPSPGLGWNSETKDEACNLSDSLTNVCTSRKSTRRPKGSCEEFMRTNVGAKLNLKCQSWTSVASTKNFDWVKTLRSGVSSSPRVSTRFHYGFNSSAERSVPLSSIHVAVPGKVVRTLFPEDGSSISSKERPSCYRSNAFSGKLQDGYKCFSAGSRHDYTIAKNQSQNHAKRAATSQKLCGDLGVVYKTPQAKHSKKVDSRRNCISESRVLRKHACSNLVTYSEKRLHSSNARKCSSMNEISDQPKQLEKGEITQESGLKGSLKFKKLCEPSEHHQRVCRGMNSTATTCAKERGTNNCNVPTLSQQGSRSIQDSCSDQMCQGKASKQNVPAGKLAVKQQQDCLEKERDALPKLKICRQPENSPHNFFSTKSSPALLEPESLEH